MKFVCMESCHEYAELLDAEGSDGDDDDGDDDDDGKAGHPFNPNQCRKLQSSIMKLNPCSAIRI